MECHKGKHVFGPTASAEFLRGDGPGMAFIFDQLSQGSDMSPSHKEVFKFYCNLT